MTRAALLLAFVGGVVVLSAAQAPDTAAHFEVASIKPANPSTLYASSGSEGPGWSATNFTLFMLVQQAYPNYGDPGRIIGGPAWIREAKFDVRAKAADVPPPAALNAMLQQLLAERFRLRIRIEARELDVYVARLARSDGRTGPWLLPTPPECAKARQERLPGPAACDGAERPIVKARAAAGERALTLLTLPMSDLFAVFRQVGGFDRAIVDRTGLEGLYDVSVQYHSADPLNVANGGTSLVAAAEDQLGLKFVRGRETLNVLIIDSVERPTPD